MSTVVKVDVYRFKFKTNFYVMAWHFLKKSNIAMLREKSLAISYYHDYGFSQALEFFISRYTNMSAV